MKTLIESYADFVVSRPLVVLVMSLLLTGVFLVGMSRVSTSQMDYSNLLPDDVAEVTALSQISDEFESSGQSLTVVVEIDPNYSPSSEPRDIRSPEALVYLDTLEKKLRMLGEATSVSGLPDIFRSKNNGILPKSRTQILEIMAPYESPSCARLADSSFEDSPFEDYVSKDYALTVIRVGIYDLSEEKEAELITEIREIIAETEKPAGIKVGLTGEAVVSADIDQLITPTMARTSSLSLLGIFVLVSLLFFSLRLGITSLLGITFGIIWVYGLVGFLGINLSSATSGSLSMIMGVGIDFGIQVVNRYTQEAKKKSSEKAMKRTLCSTIFPMSVTTLAALIGFRAMSMGQLTLLADLGNIMSLGILTCFIAAISVIPSVLLLSHRVKNHFGI
ncbi:MAG: MMPL family transporter [Candidatus Aenigmarchaeota archaeon]|nr:MMPL family transporter [Candidatus Aenigmarchaeota archaeon]